jgi:hypothetical protein
MPSYPCNPGSLTWSSPGGGCSFRPQGRLHVIDDAGALSGLRGKAWTSEDTLAARLIVGFNVGASPVYSIEDLIPIVRAVRTKQTGDPSASFILQKGIYQHRDPSKGVVQEDSAQVLIIDMAGLGEAAFENQMVELAEIIARQMQQEIVIVEIQKNGITQRVHGVEP